MVVQVREGNDLQALDLVMVIHLNGLTDMPQKSAVVERLVGEIKKQFSDVRTSKRTLVLDDLILDQERRVVARGTAEHPLAPMEYALLEYLLLHPDRVIREQILLKEVFGSNGKPRNSLWVHMHRLRKKVDDGHPRKLLFTIRGAGYVLRTPAAIVCDPLS